ncbi:AAA-domain-containing protein [Hysterangium stoloniferum]|nr:AAA-domain-containing protein [Hysterangium stoloniferum]
MARKVAVRYVSLKSSLVNLPISMYGPLVENRVRPQSLAVHLTSHATKQPVISAYVGWTGLVSSSSFAQWQSGSDEALETVEIDPQLASSLGFAEGSTLEIGLLHDLPVAKSVSTEPLSSDDWEILELHAGYVEDNLLSQVRAASMGQEIDVWVLGRTRVRFRVVSYDPQGPAVLLGTNTEVSIAPKLRSKYPRSPESAGSNSIQPVDSTAQEVHAGPKLILRALPYDVSPLKHLSQNTDPSVWVSPGTFQLLTGNAVNSSSSGSHQHSVRIRRLVPIVDPVKTSKKGDFTEGSATQARIIHKSALPSDNVQEKDQPLDCLPLLCSDEVPDHNAIFTQKLEIDDWDLIAVCLITHGEKSYKPLKNVSPMVLPALSNSPHTNLSGVDEILHRCHDFAINSFALQAQCRGMNAALPGLLLCGRPGSGRTSIVKAVTRRLKSDPKVFAYTLYVDLTKYSEERIPALKTLFQYWLNLAKWHRPSIVVLDNLDRVIPAELEHADSFRSRHLAEIFISIFAAKSIMPGVIFIVTCQGQTALHPLLMSSHLFSDVVQLKPPNKDARRDVPVFIIIGSIVASKQLNCGLQVEKGHSLNYISLATQTEGYLATDLHDLVSRAVHQATIRAAKDQVQALLRQDDFESAQIGFTPLSLRDVKLQISDISWSDIGGLHETRRVLRETLEWPTKYAAIFASCPLRLRSGLLLYGYPGCGKTLLASAVAKECGLNFISVKGPELLNKYIGASEKSVRDLFDRASAAKPCILFFDEFDSIAPKRGHDSTGVTDRVVNQLLTQMDGAEGLDGVYVLAATRPAVIVYAPLLRPGRLDKSLLCNMPEKHERKEIMEAVSKKVALAPDVDLEYYAEATAGFSGADLQALVYNAHLEVVHSTLENPHSQRDTPEVPDGGKIQYTSFGGPKVQRIMSRAEQDVMSRRLATILASHKPAQTVDNTKPVVKEKVTDFGFQARVHDSHLRKALLSSRPSVPPEERQRLSRIYLAFVAERSGQLPAPPEAGGVGNRASLM